MKWMVSIAVAALATVALGGPAAADARQRKCHFRNGIEHIAYIQFDNVHLRRDNPNVPSDLEQMPNLLNFLEDKGTLFTDHHTPLISHTAVDIVTSLTGVYGDKFGVPIGNSFGLFGPNGVTFPSSFTYWTDVLSDGLPEMLDKRGKNAPAPWVPFTRAGCDYGAFSTANIEFENIPGDVETVFGKNSPQAMFAEQNHTLAVADYEGIIIHCAQGSALCAQTSAPDILKDEPGGYTGFTALYGNANVQPQISPSGPVKDLDGNVIADSEGNPGFPGFDPTPAQTLGYLATMLEAGVPVVTGYIEDAHDNNQQALSGVDPNEVAFFGPGEAGYVKTLAAFDPLDGPNGNTNQLTAALADQAEQKLLHMVTADPNRTPNFIMFGNPDYFFLTSGKTPPPLCTPDLQGCSSISDSDAWNHGDFQNQITKTWLGAVGPGVLNLGRFGEIFSDHTDIRPTILSLAGLKDDYAHDGRVLFEALDDEAVPDSLRDQRDTLSALAEAYNISRSTHRAARSVPAP
jgi:hypothetical protein